MRSAALLLILAAIAAYVIMAKSGRRRRGHGSWGHGTRRWDHNSGRRSSSWSGRWTRMKPAGHALTKSRLRNPGVY